jgi:autotransporter-associated beta strand protein
VIPNVENLAGSNTIAGNIYMQTGGSNIVFQSDSGTLVLAGALQYIGSLTSARTFNFFGAGNTTVAGPILFSAVAPLNVGKFGIGTLMLNGTNSYAGSTMINAGTLAGNGVIASPVTVAPGAFLSPGGNAIGALTINNNLTNNGAFVIRLKRSGNVLTNDSVNGISTLAFGGPLQLVATGDPITVSNTFKIFSAATYQNFISGIAPAMPGTNLLWNTNNLAVNGTLSVALGSPKPQFGNIFLSGTNLVLAGGGGAAGYNFSVFTSTNLTTPQTNWAPAGTGLCDGNGNFIITNGFFAANRCQFYLVRIP